MSKANQLVDAVVGAQVRSIKDRSQKAIVKQAGNIAGLQMMQTTVVQDQMVIAKEADALLETNPNGFASRLLAAHMNGMEDGAHAFSTAMSGLKSEQRTIEQARQRTADNLAQVQAQQPPSDQAQVNAAILAAIESIDKRLKAKNI